MRQAFFLALGVFALLAILLSAWVSSSLRSDDRLLEVWNQEIFDGLEPAERFPPRSPNETALSLEALAAEMGLDFSTKHRSAAPPAKEASENWERAYEPLRAHHWAVRASKDDRLPTLGPELATFMERNKGSLINVRELLLSEAPPVWELDIEGGAETPLPNFSAQLHLHRLLELAAHRAINAKDEASAKDFLEAAWRLGRDSTDNPMLIANLIHLAQLKGELLVLRRLCSPDAHWHERLATIDLQPRILRSMQLDTWVIHRTIRTGGFYSETIKEGYEQFESMLTIHRLMYRHFAEAVQHSVERLRTQDPLTFEATAFAREQYSRIPSWNFLSRGVFPNFFDAWVRTVRTELAAEHTLLVLDKRGRLAEGLRFVPKRTSSAVVPGLYWLEEPTEDGIRVALESDFDTGETHPMALDFTIARGTCED